MASFLPPNKPAPKPPSEGGGKDSKGASASDDDLTADEILSSFTDEIPAIEFLADALTEQGDVQDRNIAQALVECARYGIFGKDKADGSSGLTQSDSPFDLTCAYCFAHLWEPTTLQDGYSVCKSCVSKRAEHLAEQTKDAHAGGIWLEFGSRPNVTLSSLSAQCMPACKTAAQLRLEGNALCRDKTFEESIAMYTAAIEACPSDVPLYSNRAAAFCRLSDDEDAMIDARKALCLCSWQKIHPSEPMYTRVWGRLVHALSQRDGTDQIELLTVYIIAVSCGVIGYERKYAQALHKLIVKLRRSDIKCAKTQASFAGDSSDMLKLYPLQVLGHSLCKREFLYQNERSAFKKEILSALIPGAEGLQRSITKNEMEKLRGELDCALCFNLLFEPATLPCGHVLCRPCLARTLDHAFNTTPKCPLCRFNLHPFSLHVNTQARALVESQNSEKREFSYGAKYISVDHELEKILVRHFPDEYEERGKLVLAEEAPARGRTNSCGTQSEVTGIGEDETRPGSLQQEEIPIFICSVALPGVHCPLHVFEPRYRLMMRRCVESDPPVFGMVPSSPDRTGGAQYGTLLRILDFEQLPDGRSRLDTVGVKRFEVLAYGMKDGYSVGNVVWVDDHPDFLMEASLSAQFREVHRKMKEALGGMGHRATRSIVTQFGPVPESPSNLMNWIMVVGSVLFGIRNASDPSVQYSFLFDNETRQSQIARVKLFVHFFGHLPLFQIQLPKEKERGEDGDVHSV